MYIRLQSDDDLEHKIAWHVKRGPYFSSNYILLEQLNIMKWQQATDKSF